MSGSNTKINLEMKLASKTFIKELKKIVKQFEKMLGIVKKLNTALGRVVKTQTRGQARAAAATNKHTGAIRKQSAALKKRNLALRMGSKALKAGGAALAVYAGTLGVAKLLSFAEAAQTTTNRLRVAQRPGEDLGKSFNKIAAIAKRTRQPLVELATMYQRITLATKGMNVTQAQAFKITENFGKLLTIQGASAHEARSALTQFTQALQSGKLAGDEFRSISENLPPVLDALVLATKRPRDQLKLLAEEGKLSTDLLLKAMLMATDKIDKDFRKTSMTVAQAGNLINTELTMLVKGFMDSKNGANALVYVFNNIIDTIRLVAGAINLVLQGINAIINAVGALAEIGKGIGSVFSSLMGFNEDDVEQVNKRTEALAAFGVIAKDINDVAANRFGAMGEGTGTDGGEGALPPGEEKGQNIRTLTAGFIKRNMKNLTMTFDAFKQNFQDSVMQTFVHDFPAGVGNAFADMVMEGKSMTKAMGALFKDMAKQVISALIKMVVQMLIMKAIMMALGVNSFGELTGGGGKDAPISPLAKFIPGFGGMLGKKASGGPVTGGTPYVVGEEGPELFTPSSSGNITPNDEMGGAMGGGVIIQNLSIMPNSSIDQALMDKPPSYWLEIAQEKILPALNTLGQGGETTSLEFRGVR